MFYTDRLLTTLTAMACLLTAGAFADDSKAPAAQAEAKGDLSQDEIKNISTALGHFLGRNLNTPGIHFDLESVIQGMRDGSAGKPAPMTEKEFEETMAQLQRRAYEKQAEVNLKAANDYLQNNAKQDKVVVVEPGKLQYLVLEQGNGPAVDSHGNPQINYTGKYIDGSVFSSSADLGGPINVPLDQTIPGFSKGITGMKEGEKRRLFIHPDYGYGTMGQLPPNSLLIFDIEVVKAEAPKSSETDDEDLLQLQLDEDDADEDEDHPAHKEKKS